MENVMNVFTDETAKEWLTEVLRGGVVGVEFVKLDGTKRSMSCTLDEDVIPAESLPKTTSETPHAKSKDALAVFDVEKGEWRSFRWDSITAVTFG
jgi:hypothetical protein